METIEELNNRTIEYLKQHHPHRLNKDGKLKFRLYLGFTKEELLLEQLEGSLVLDQAQMTDHEFVEYWHTRYEEDRNIIVCASNSYSMLKYFYGSEIYLKSKGKIIRMLNLKLSDNYYQHCWENINNILKE